MVAIPRCVNGAVYGVAKGFAREKIMKTGFCEIRNFLKPEYVTALISEAESLKSCGFRSYERHNIYLEDGAASKGSAEATGSGGRQSATELRAIETPIREATFESSKVLVNQQQIPANSPLLELYKWDGLKDLLRNAFGLETLYPSGDPVGGVYFNFFDRGDKLGWHFDRSEYAMNLILRESEEGGEFMYLPDSRAEFDDISDSGGVWSEDKCVNREKLIVPPLAPGSLYLFAGNRSLHCVTENGSKTTSRLNAIFTYNTEPNVTLNEYTRKKFFGV